MLPLLLWRARYLGNTLARLANILFTPGWRLMYSMVQDLVAVLVACVDVSHAVLFFTAEAHCGYMQGME